MGTASSSERTQVRLKAVAAVTFLSKLDDVKLAGTCDFPTLIFVYQQQQNHVYHWNLPSVRVSGKIWIYHFVGEVATKINAVARGKLERNKNSEVIERAR